MINPNSMLRYRKFILKADVPSVQRIDFKPTYRKAIRVDHIHWHVTPILVPGDFHFSGGISKLPVDSTEIPVTNNDVLDDENIYGKAVLEMVLQTSVGVTNQWLNAEQDFSEHPLYFVMDPTYVAFATGRTVYLELDYVEETVSVEEFNQILQWQGGFKNRTV